MWSYLTRATRALLRRRQCLSRSRTFDASRVSSGSPEGWTAIETHSTDGSPDGTTIIHLCPACRPMLRDLFAWLERGGAPRSTQLP